MGSQPENLYVDDKGTGVREFRVSSMRRYKVTDWESFNGATGKSGVRIIAENLTLEQANQIAETYGQAFPGSLVNTMDPEEGCYSLPKEQLVDASPPVDKKFEKLRHALRDLLAPGAREHLLKYPAFSCDLRIPEHRDGLELIINGPDGELLSQSMVVTREEIENSSYKVLYGPCVKAAFEYANSSFHASVLTRAKDNVGS